MKSGRTLLLIVACATLIALPCQAQQAIETSTEAVEHCVAAHEQARILRVDSQWLEAREAMRRCAMDTCPLAIRSDCRAWLDEIGRLMPTVLIVVERDDDGKQPVRLEIDGQLRELPIPAKPLEVLPGPHRLRLSLPGFPPVERELLLEPGEKNQLVSVRFARERLPQPASPLPVQLWPAPRATRPVPIATYLLSGGALAAFSVSAALLLSGLSAKADAEETCAPDCSSDTRQSIDLRILLADVAGAAGVVLGGLSVYTFVSRPVVYDRASARLPTSTPAARPWALSFEGRF